VPSEGKLKKAPTDILLGPEDCVNRPNPMFADTVRVPVLAYVTPAPCAGPGTLDHVRRHCGGGG
jgi:hypothetical protein